MVSVDTLFVRLKLKLHRLKHDGILESQVVCQVEAETPSAKARWYPTLFTQSLKMGISEVGYVAAVSIRLGL